MVSWCQAATTFSGLAMASLHCSTAAGTGLSKPSWICQKHPEGNRSSDCSPTQKLGVQAEQLANVIRLGACIMCKNGVIKEYLLDSSPNLVPLPPVTTEGAVTLVKQRPCMKLIKLID